MKKIIRRLAALVCALALCLTPASALSVEQALELLEEYYIDALPAAAYEAKTLDELFVAVGDPYTYYMDAVENESFVSQMEGKDTVSGIGVTVEYTEQGIRILSVFDGGGAKEVGLQPDDCIIAVDGTSCVPANETHRRLILGESGTTVTLTIRHPDGTEQQYGVRRGVIVVPNTLFTMSGGAGVIDCDSFGSQTESYFNDSVRQYNDKVTHWVIDLRDNLGGYTDPAIGAIGTFTGIGVKLYFRESNGETSRVLYFSDAKTEKPAIILVDGRSASSSELVASGIRAERAGIVIGSRTYGKGTAQIVLDKSQYPDLFDEDSLKITASRFYCSNGITTDRIGVLPTLLVSDEFTADVAALLSAAPPESDEALHLTLNGIAFYIDPEDVRDPENADVLSELFSALPPDVVVNCPIDGMSLALDPQTAARYYGIDYAGRGFSDTAASPYASKINTLATYGILSGDGTGRFHPGDMLTRAELSSMLSHALNVIALRSMGFTDVAEDQWYAPAVNVMAMLGFMEGIGGGRFAPNGTLTQEQLITVMGRLARFLNFGADDYALALSEEQLSAFDRFQPWARAGAAVLTDYSGNMLYTGLSAIDPSAPATREQAAATLCSILKTLDVLSY